jgi:hypothetical protein
MLAGKDAVVVGIWSTPMADLFSMSHRTPTIEMTPRAAAPTTALSRTQVVDEIIEINPSATASFLAQFDDELLRKYLDHLHYTQGPRGSGSWDRPNDAPAIMVRRRVV